MLASVAALLAIVVVVAVLLATMGGGDDSAPPTSAAADSPTSTEEAFKPNLDSADFAAGWRDKQTGDRVTPPQSIKVIGNLDVRKEVEKIGYGPVEQSMPKMAKYAQTDSSFPRNPAISVDTDADGYLRVSWGCETMYDDPPGADCGSYNMTVDISGAEPKIIKSAAERVGPHSPSSTSTTVKVAAMSVSNPDTLPSSIMGTDKLTGAPTALMLSAVQPRKSSPKVYFITPDALKIFIGELHSTR